MSGHHHEQLKPLEARKEDLKYYAGDYLSQCRARASLTVSVQVTPELQRFSPPTP